MKFNDYQIISPKDSEIIAQEYNKILTKEIEDLEEIKLKMIEQKKELLAKNNPRKFNDIIGKLTDDISKLDSIISSTKNSTTRSASGYTKSIPDTFRKVAKLDDNSRLSPYRSLDEMNTVTDRENIPTVPQNPSLDIPIVPPQNSQNSPSRNNTSKALMRGRPMQSFNLFNRLAKTFMKKNISTKVEKDRLKYHIIVQENCNHNRILHNQIDIIRLLLLYLTLRPNCKYTSLISTIASDQFDCYLNMQ